MRLRLVARRLGRAFPRLEVGLTLLSLVFVLFSFDVGTLSFDADAFEREWHGALRSESSANPPLSREAQSFRFASFFVSAAALATARWAIVDVPELWVRMAVCVGFAMGQVASMLVEYGAAGLGIFSLRGCFYLLTAFLALFALWVRPVERKELQWWPATPAALVTATAASALALPVAMAVNPLAEGRLGETERVFHSIFFTDDVVRTHIASEGFQMAIAIVAMSYVPARVQRLPFVLLASFRMIAVHTVLEDWAFAVETPSRQGIPLRNVALHVGLTVGLLALLALPNRKYVGIR